MLGTCQVHNAGFELTVHGLQMLHDAHALFKASKKFRAVLISRNMWRASGSGCAGSDVTMSGRNRVSGPRKRSTPTPQLRGVHGYGPCSLGLRALRSEAPKKQRAPPPGKAPTRRTPEARAGLGIHALPQAHVLARICVELCLLLQVRRVGIMSSPWPVSCVAGIPMESAWSAFLSYCKIKLKESQRAADLGNVRAGIAVRLFDLPRHLQPLVRRHGCPPLPAVITGHLPVSTCPNQMKNEVITCSQGVVSDVLLACLPSLRCICMLLHLLPYILHPVSAGVSSAHTA